MVSSVDVEMVVVDADIVVGVAGGYGEGDGGGDEVWSGDVQGVDGGVLEHKLRLRRLQNGPCYENNDRDSEAEDQKSDENPAEDFGHLAVVVFALLAVVVFAFAILAVVVSALLPAGGGHDATAGLRGFGRN